MPSGDIARRRSSFVTSITTDGQQSPRGPATTLRRRYSDRLPIPSPLQPLSSRVSRDEREGRFVFHRLFFPPCLASLIPRPSCPGHRYRPERTMYDPWGRKEMRPIAQWRAHADGQRQTDQLSYFGRSAIDNGGGQLLVVGLRDQGPSARAEIMREQQTAVPPVSFARDRQCVSVQTWPAERRRVCASD